jgi:hypothetical protein
VPFPTIDGAGIERAGLNVFAMPGRVLAVLVGGYHGLLGARESVCHAVIVVGGRIRHITVPFVVVRVGPQFVMLLRRRFPSRLR